MSDWIREGLDDLAKEAPTALEVPTTLPRRARRRIALTVVGSLVVVVALTAVAMAGGQALLDRREPFTRPTPTPPFAPESSPDTVRVVLSSAGCGLHRSGDVIDPKRVKFVFSNDTGEWASFDIGWIKEGRSFAELTADVDALGGSAVEEVEDLSPGYFGSVVARGHVDGRAGRILVDDLPRLWTSPYRPAPAGDYAVICARGRRAGGPFVPAGVAGPVRLGERTPGGGTPEEGVLLADVVLDDDGCRIDQRFVSGSVDIDYAAFDFQNNGATTVAFDVARIDHGLSFEQLASSIASLSGRDDPRFPDSVPPHLERAQGSGGIGTALGGMYPVTNPFTLDRHGEGASWNGPTEGIVGEQSLVVVCYRDGSSGPGLSPVAVLGPFVIR